MNDDPGNESGSHTPYRDGDKSLRDTGRSPKFMDEKAHMSNAGMFDTLVETNISLVKTMRMGMKTGVIFLVSFALIAMVMMTSAAVVLRQGQIEIREILLVLTNKTCL